MKETLLTISMLVSGREETTEKSLISLQPLREKLGAEIILTNTGCTPEYLEKIKTYADRILEFSWCNDFAKARNVGLEAAAGEWFMFIDDDEWFEDVTPLICFFESGEYKEYHQAVYQVRNYSNMEGTAYSDEWVSRLIRKEEDTHFEGSVHEYLMPARGKCKQIPAFVHHYGYVFQTEEESQAHFKRNVKILESLLEREPNNMKWPLQLLKECHAIGDYERIGNISAESLDKISMVDENFMNMCRGAFYIGILMADANSGDYAAMWQHYTLFMENEKNSWNVSCGMSVFMLLEAPEEEEKLWICARNYMDAVEKHKQKSYSEQEEIIEESIVFVSEYAKGLSKYAQGIKERINGNGEFLLLPSRVWMLARLGVLPLEDMLLELPLTQWMAQIQILQMQGYNNQWGEIANQLAGICSKTDIRYIYFDMVLETIKMKQIYALKVNVDKMNYETMTQIITDFVQANLNYMDFMYTAEAFEGDMELFSQEEKAALWIANALSVDVSQWKVKLQCLSEAAKICSMLSDFIKRYMQLLGEELMKKGI